MLEQLFGSKTRLKVLQTLYRDPQKAYFVRELGRAIGVQINAVRRELTNLQKIGLVQEIEKEVKDKSKSGATLRKYYQLDSESVIFNELHQLILKGQVMGEKEFVEDLKKKGGTVLLLVLTGHFTGDQEAPTDVLLVGDLKPRTITRIVTEYEKKFGFPIRFTTMEEKEFAERRYIMDKFLFTIFDCKHVKAVNYLEA